MTETKHTLWTAHLNEVTQDIEEDGRATTEHVVETYGSDAQDKAKLIAAARNSYDKHCTNPVESAEADLLGEALEALEAAHDELSDTWGDEYIDSDDGKRCAAILSKTKRAGQ